jgi:hypothetical protein
MFGAKTRLKSYLKQIQGWPMGLNNRGWLPEDFRDPAVKEARLDPTAVIFPIIDPPLSAFDAFFLTKEQYQAYINFKQAVSNFNAALAVVNSSRRDMKETYYGLIVLLHTFTIGSYNTGGLYDAYINLIGRLN